ncbi:hypothetical protein MNEG_12472 [Monoraphidium neglectum]|uniref:IspG TIM-barrel domain-containing protein n=1 Tax=Monoraphidium neglectum TaxID=145388 RepID=A0A0D2KI61_9CHLO|nr:hypothetical protein MNEG_12472 [Monoraphidium neglectum]KIY95488.1 hypothetical protein MNEG_12472 [Monoraphidium neglectum]|eukprot:XP_013894508.1 hypothetical protein MNEG_12472 [Monoraphidium neglectum]
MTTTDTRDVAKTVEQVKRCADAGADIVRITVQGRREAEACMKIREQLFKDGYDTPLVADIHFQPAVAMMVAEAFEKVKQLWRGAHGKARGSKTGASAQKKVQKASKCAAEMNGTRV